MSAHLQPGYFDGLGTVEEVNAAQAARDDKGNFLFNTSPTYRHHLEARRVQLMSGQQATAKEAATGEAKVVAFVSAQPGSVPQLAPGEVDQRAIDFLNNWRHEHPDASSREVGIWERDLAEVLRGRRYGETPEAFAARQRDEAPASAPAVAGEAPQTVVPISAFLDSLPASTDEAEAIQRAHDAATAAGVPAETFHSVMTDAATASLQGEPLQPRWSEPGQSVSLFGMVLRVPEGVQLNMHDPSLHAVVKSAVQHGLSREQIEAGIAAFAAEK
jgi:hypothetical protein